MAVLLPVNTSGRVRKMKPRPDVTMDNLHLLSTTKFTKRICLSIVNGMGDYLGIASPFLLRFKLLMKDIFEQRDIGWNDEIQEDAKLVWIDLIKEAVFEGYLCFPRTTKPANAIGGPMIVSFGDGSFAAFAAAVYLRWAVPCDHLDKDLCDGDFFVQLLCAKSRVTPFYGLTIPCGGLCGLVLSSRLTLTVSKALSIELSMYPTGAILLSDSECSISALDKSTSALQPYFHNRVSEIRNNLKEIGDIFIGSQMSSSRGTQQSLLPRYL